MIQFINQIDYLITEIIFNLPSSYFAVTWMRFFSFEGIFVFIWLFIFAVIYRKHLFHIYRHRLLVEILIVLLVLNAFMNVIIKPVFKRDRPLIRNVPVIKTNNIIEKIFYVPNVTNARPPRPDSYPNDYSFPSGHAALAFASATLLSLRDKKRRGLYFLFACLVGFSRIYLGYHYFFDAVGGAVIGIITAVIFNRFFKKA